MDILASLTGAAAALPATATTPGQPALPEADPAFAAMLLDAPGAPASPGPVPAMPQPGAPPIVDLAGLTPAAPDEVAATPPTMPDAPLPTPPVQAAPPAPDEAKPTRPQPLQLTPSPPLQPDASNQPTPAPEIAIVADAALPQPSTPPRKREPASSVEADADPEAPEATPLAPVIAPVAEALRPVAQKPVRSAGSDKPRAADAEAAPPPGFARVATTPAAERAAPEAAFRIEAAPLAAEPAAAPAATPVTLPASAPATPSSSPVVAAPPERHQPSLQLGDAFGERMGVAIARRLGEGGEELIVRMEPAELGRIQVRLSFDEQGSLRAVLAAESGSVVEALRRDAGELARALSDAGVRTDAQSFRFDRGGSGQGEQGQAAWARWQNQQSAHGRSGGEMAGPGEEIVYRPMRRNGRLDLVA